VVPLAHCWVLEDSPENALSKAAFHVFNYDWELERIERPPVETSKDHFIGKDLGLVCGEKGGYFTTERRKKTIDLRTQKAIQS